MPVEVKSYRCKTCWAVYSDIEKAIKCEESHIKPLEIIGYQYPVIGMERRFPQAVTVKFEDDRELQYVLPRISQQMLAEEEREKNHWEEMYDK